VNGAKPIASIHTIFCSKFIVRIEEDIDEERAAAEMAANSAA
jgi:hypothetical protein